MAYDAHDVRLLSRFVNGVTHRLAINREAFVFLGEGHVPLLQSEIELDRINSDQYIPNDGFAGNDALFIFATTPKACTDLAGRIL